MVKAHELIDFFAGEVIDAAIWPVVSESIQQNDGLIIPASSVYPAAISVPVDLVNSSFVAEIDTFPNVATSVEMLILFEVDSDNSIALGYINGVLYARKKEAGVTTNDGWTPVADNRFLKIRHDDGVVSWEISPDGVVWQALNGPSQPAFDVSEGQIILLAGNFDDDPDPGEAIFAGLNSIEYSSHIAYSISRLNQSATSEILDDALDGLVDIATQSQGDGLLVGIRNLHGSWTVTQGYMDFFTQMISFNETIVEAKLMARIRSTPLLVQPVEIEARKEPYKVFPTFLPPGDITNNNLLATFVPPIETSTGGVFMDAIHIPPSSITLPTEGEAEGIYPPVSMTRIRFNSVPNRTRIDTDPRGMNAFRDPVFARSNIGTIPLDWLKTEEATPPIPDGDGLVSDEESFIGEKSLKITPNTEMRTTRYYSGVDTALQQTSTFRARMKATSDFDGEVKLRLAVSYLSVNDPLNEVEVSITTSWAEYEVVLADYFSPSSTGYWLTSFVVVTGTSGAVYVDDVHYSSDSRAFAGTAIRPGVATTQNPMPMTTLISRINIKTTGAPDIGFFGMSFFTGALKPYFSNNNLGEPTLSSASPQGTLRMEPGQYFISDRFVMDSTTTHTSTFPGLRRRTHSNFGSGHTYRGGRISFGFSADAFGDLSARISMTTDDATPIECVNILIERNAESQTISVETDDATPISETYLPLVHRYIRIRRTRGGTNNVPTLLDDFMVETSPDNIGWEGLAVIENPAWKNSTFTFGVFVDPTSDARVFLSAFNTETNLSDISQVFVAQDRTFISENIAIMDFDFDANNAIFAQSRFGSGGLVNSQDLSDWSVYTVFGLGHLRVTPKSTATTLANAISNDSYFEFTIANLPHVNVDIDGIAIASQKTASGNFGFGFATSADGYASVVDMPITKQVEENNLYLYGSSSAFFETIRANSLTVRLYLYGESSSRVDIRRITLFGWAGEVARSFEGKFRMWVPFTGDEGNRQRPLKTSLRHLGKKYPEVRSFSGEDIDFVDGSGFNRLNEADYILIRGGDAERLFERVGTRSGYALAPVTANSEPYQGGLLWTGSSTDESLVVNKRILARFDLTSAQWTSFIFAASTTEWYEARFTRSDWTLSIIHRESGIDTVLSTSEVMSTLSTNGPVLFDISWRSESISVLLRDDISSILGRVSVIPPTGGPTSGWWGLAGASIKFGTATPVLLDFVDILEELPELVSPPIITSTSATETSITLSFFPPEEDLGFTVTNYEYSTDNGSTWTARNPASTESPLVISNLTISTAYQVLLRTISSNGAGLSAQVTVATLPSAPDTVTASGSDGAINVSWSSISSVNNYQYRVNSGSWVSVGNVTSTIITGLNHDTTYTIDIRGQNNSGFGASNSDVATTTDVRFTGGTVSNVGSYRVHVFNNSGTLTKVTAASVPTEVLIVAGGGLSGATLMWGNYGAGGGGVRNLSTTVTTSATNVVVGAAGSNSSFGGTSATAGGDANSMYVFGPNSQTDCDAKNGNGGGSGGGGLASGGSGGSRVSGQGNVGGNGAGPGGTYTDGQFGKVCVGRDAYWGGGGGAGGAGANATTSSNGAGGAGAIYNWTGSSIRYGCGEGGGRILDGKAANGTGYSAVNFRGNAGYSGVVIVRYLVS